MAEMNIDALLKGHLPTPAEIDDMSGRAILEGLRELREERDRQQDRGIIE